MKTYEFDVKMWANVHIEAPTKAAAVAALEAVLEELEPDIAGWNAIFKHKRVTISEFSLAPEASDIGDEEVT